MQNTVDPYAPPSTSTDEEEPAPPDVGPKAWVEGNELVTVVSGVVLPDVCIRCAAPGRGELEARTFSWHHWALYLLAVVFPVLYLFVHVYLRRRARVTFWMCERCRRKQRPMLVRGLVAIASGLLAIWWFPDIWAAVLIPTAIIAIVFLNLAGRTLSPTHIDRKVARFAGAGPKFLDLLTKQNAGKVGVSRG